MCGIQPHIPSEERRIIETLLQRHAKMVPKSERCPRGRIGSSWCIIEAKWWRQWLMWSKNNKNYTSIGRNNKCGPMDNHMLLKADGLALRTNLVHLRDFELVPQEVYTALQAWHDGGPCITRTVTPITACTSTDKNTSSACSSNSYTIECDVELYPYSTRVYLYDIINDDDTRPFQQCALVSRYSTVLQLIRQWRLELGSAYTNKTISPANDSDASLSSEELEGRVWHRFISSSASNDHRREDSISQNSDTTWTLLALNDTLPHYDTHNITSSTASAFELLLEFPHNGIYYYQTNYDRTSLLNEDSLLSSIHNNSMLSRSHGQSVRMNTFIGLHNLGNTCYLNTIVQCLAHTPILREYFALRYYVSDINQVNPLGYQGQLAVAYADLVGQLLGFNFPTNHSLATTANHHMTSANKLTSAVHPHIFHNTLTKLSSSQFSSNEQHDAQEFLTFLLSGLSEDCNLIQHKPTVSYPDSDGTMADDGTLAEIWWSNHLSRECSLCTVLFTGQYRSSLVCGTCTYQSCRFEPFMYLTLPVISSSNNLSLSNINSREICCIVYRNVTDITTEQSQEEIFVKVKVEANVTLKDLMMELAKELLQRQKHTTSNDNIECTTHNDTKDNDANTENEGTEKDENEELSEMVENLVVVDLRDCRIQSITPQGRLLSQVVGMDADTGHVPKLHVFQLDRIPNSNTHDNACHTSSTTMSKTIPSCSVPVLTSKSSLSKERVAYLAICQRIPHSSTCALSKTNCHNHTYLHNTVLTLCGTPILLRCAFSDLQPRSHGGLPTDNENTHQQQQKKQWDVYAEVAHKIQPYAVLSPVQAQTDSSSEGKVRYNFSLKLTTRDGKRCSRCSWLKCCTGCVIPEHYHTQSQEEECVVIRDGDTIAIDWNMQTYYEYHQKRETGIDKSLTRLFTNGNSSGSSSMSGTSKPVCAVSSDTWLRRNSIQLEDCLAQFSKVETISEAYCSKCKSFNPATKHMSVWRLPPILIVHLKRFQYDRDTRRKLRQHVVFPVHGLNLARVMATKGQQKNVKQANEMKRVEKKVNDRLHVIDNDKKEFENLNDSGSAVDVAGARNNATDVEELNDPENSENIAGANIEGLNDSGNSEYVAGTKNNAADINSDSDTEDQLYDLYGIVHHLGALHGGHYVASLRSEIDGKWRLFNDAQITEISEADIVDASAYILFYIRRDVKDMKLEDVWNKTHRTRVKGQDNSFHDDSGVTEEDIQKIIRQRDRCIIS